MPDIIFLNPDVISSDLLSYLTGPKTKYISFTITKDKEMQHIFTTEKLGRGNALEAMNYLAPTLWQNFVFDPCLYNSISIQFNSVLFINMIMSSLYTKSGP